MTEIVEYEGTDLVQRPAVGLFGTDDPEEIMGKAANVARVLKDVIVQQKLTATISGREYVLFEGLTTLAALVGVSVKTEYTRPIDTMGWEASAVVVNQQGREIGRAEAECLRNEKNWGNRDDYAIRSMAQTRAAAKALRQQLGFVIVLAGYDATPAEEMPAGDVEIPFDTGPAQGSFQAPANIGEADTGGAGLTQRLLDLSAQLGKDVGELQEKIWTNKRTHDDKPHLHVAWLKRQIKMAEEKLAEKASAAGAEAAKA